MLTYKILAHMSGVKNPRVVGNELHKNPDPQNIPCHRVVDSRGRLAKNFAFGGLNGQKKRLEEEGVTVKNFSVDLSIFLWRP